MKQYLLIPALLFCYCFTTLAQQNKHNDNKNDSVETFSRDITKGKYKKDVEKGDTLYTYIPEVWELQPKVDIKTDTKTNSKRTAVKQMQMAGYGGDYMDLSHIPESHAVSTSKDVGEIAITQGTASGALSYSVPVDCYQAGNGMSPSVQIAYNSMSGNGVVGYGWQIGGISSITVSNSNIYFDGAPSAVRADKTNAFVLDGMRLINLQTGSGNEVYYQTEQGNIKVTAFTNSNAASYFKVYYPNGNVGIYGYEGMTSSQQPIFMLTKMTDVQNNTINYTYTSVGYLYYISEINYGGREGTTPANNYAKVTFTYETRDDVTRSYYNGTKLLQDLRLKEVNSYFNNQLLRTYGFTYENSVSSLLKQIDCSSNGKSLNPLIFYYGENNQMTRFEKGSTILTEYFSNASVPNLILSKGKFDTYSQDDGLIAYPNKSTYGLLVTKKNGSQVLGYQYGSTYSPDQQLLTYNDLSSGFSMPAKLTAESGFQQLVAMDVDGDGKDELVKSNSSVLNSTTERITYKVYDVVNYLGSTYPSLRYSFYTDYGGVVEWSGLYSPSVKAILTGDFMGNGKQTNLTITYNKNIKGASVQSWATLVDFDNRTKSTIYDKACFSLTAGDRIFVMDYDGDGKADICHMNAIGTCIYTFNTNGQLYQITQYGTPDKYSSSGRHMLIGDVNGDGKTDIMLSPLQKYWVDGWVEDCGNCGYCNGYDPNLTSCFEPIYHDGYYENDTDVWYIYYSQTYPYPFEQELVSIVPYTANCKFILQDMNGDGKPDLVANDAGTISLYPAINGGFSNIPEAETVTVNAQAHFIPGNIESGYKMSQLFSIYDHQLEPITFTRNVNKEQLLTGVVTSMGVVSKHQYNNMRDSYGAYSVGAKCSYPYRNLYGNMNLYAAGDSYVSGNRVASTSYSYTKGVIDLRGKGFTGFEETKTYDNIRNTTVTQIFDPFNFCTAKSVDSPVASASYNYYVSVASNKIAKVTLGYKTEQDKLKNISATTSYTYDAYSNPTQEIVDYGGGLKVTTDNSYSNSTTTPYKLGELYNQVVTTQRYGQTWVTRKYIPAFVSGTGLPIVVVNFSNGQATSNTVYTYENGLVKKESLQNYSATTKLETQYNYDAFGRVTRKTDPLGLYVDYNYDAKSQISSAKNHKGLITSYEYDDWGRKTKETSADGTVAAASLAWTSSPTGALVQTTSTATGKPSAQSYADALGREMRSGEMHFDGSYLYTDKVYDGRGRLEKSSVPFKGGAPTQWNTCVYDDYDRITTLSHASGKTDSYSYDGNSVTATIDGVAKTTAKDATGKVVTVVDPAGTIAYNYRADGQPSAIYAPGGIITSFEYDDYGRQTKLIDPSAGTKSYYYDAAGNVNSEIDANNKEIKTTYDAYNRITRKEIVGELTTDYVYNTDGQISSITGNNGTSKSYGYDALMRLNTETENVPDGKYLQKSYTYANGTTTDISYSSQNGAIATENYLYSNGCLAETKLNNATSTWKLTQENDMGLAIAASTGNLTRTYGYDAYGLPTARTIRNGATVLQDFAYNIDPTTGNLNWRKDATRNIQENFGYDNLNRLTSFRGITMAYDVKGNITDYPGVGSFAYNRADKPYAVTGITPYGTAIPLRDQTITYNAMQRPTSIAENGYLATLAYNSDGDRVKMQITQNGGDYLTRYYIGGQYETEAGIAGTKEKLYLSGDAYSAAAVLVKENGGVWNIYYLGRDYQGSITHLIDASGTVVQDLSYDPWGRLRNPANQELYAVGAEPTPFLGRGYTGHEHLTMFGLINMNARLYDPAVGRFLSPDPYVQSPDFSQNFNRYSYCLNNPLKYTDQSGEYFLIDDIIGAVISGVINVATNLGNIHSFGQGLSYFGVGASGYIVSEYASPIVGGMYMSAANNILSQGFANGFKNINFSQVIFSGITGGLTAQMGQYIGKFVGPGIGKFASTLTKSPVIQQAITQSTTNAISGFTIGAGFSLADGKSLGDALASGGQGALMGFGIGAVNGVVSGVKYSHEYKVDPWTGKSQSTTVTYNGVATDLTPTLERIQNGEGYPHRNDGSIFQNRPLSGETMPLLPEKPAGYYREFVHPTPGVNGAGLQRIVTGSGGEIWYTPNHYKTFIPIKR
jgi:RHS repeat-associated protein